MRKTSAIEQNEGLIHTHSLFFRLTVLSTDCYPLISSNAGQRYIVASNGLLKERERERDGGERTTQNDRYASSLCLLFVYVSLYLSLDLFRHWFISYATCCIPCPSKIVFFSLSLF
jgi:hypothetical protein